MMMSSSTLKKAGLVAVAATLFLAAGVHAAAVNTKDPCFVPSSGPVPPPGCEYISPADVHNKGLQDVLKLEAKHKRFLNVKTSPGGTLGGEVEHFDSTLELTFTGINELAGYSTTVDLPAVTETHVGPRNEKDAVQKFETDMHFLEGTLKETGDFEYLHIVAGTGNGLPSPGSTVLTQQSDGRYFVDSVFDIHYTIEFKGAKGSKLEGIEGKSEGSVTMQAFGSGRE